MQQIRIPMKQIRYFWRKNNYVNTVHIPRQESGLTYSTLPIQFNSIQFNSIQFNSIQFNSIQSIQFNSIQFNSINSIQFNSIQFNSIQFRIKWNIIQYVYKCVFSLCKHCSYSETGTWIDTTVNLIYCWWMMVGFLVGFPFFLIV